MRTLSLRAEWGDRKVRLRRSVPAPARRFVQEGQLAWQRGQHCLGKGGPALVLRGCSLAHTGQLSREELRAAAAWAGTGCSERTRHCPQACAAMALSPGHWDRASRLVF